MRRCCPGLSSSPRPHDGMAAAAGGGDERGQGTAARDKALCRCATVSAPSACNTIAARCVGLAPPWENCAPRAADRGEIAAEQKCGRAARPVALSLSRSAQSKSLVAQSRGRGVIAAAATDNDLQCHGPRPDLRRRRSFNEKHCRDLGRCNCWRWPRSLTDTTVATTAAPSSLSGCFRSHRGHGGPHRPPPRFVQCRLGSRRHDLVWCGRQTLLPQ